MINQSESDHQQALFVWAAYSSGQFPELELMYSIPNGAHVSDRNRKRLICEGLKKGMPDIHLPVARGNYSSMYLELKTPKGKLSEFQKNRIHLLEKAGNYCTVSKSFEESVILIQSYLTAPSLSLAEY